MEVTTAAFLTKASPQQFKHVLALYSEALKIKAESKSKKPQELIKLDDWYQNTLPGLIQARSPDYHLNHEELVNTMKWKLARGKFRPRLKELVTMNSPRVVMQESKKAYRALFKKDDLTSAINYLCNLKGIGPATASAILTAAFPTKACFMADECLQAVPEIEGIDYTVQEYLELMRHVKQAQLKLNSADSSWTPHNIELTLWTHNILLTYKPELLANVPSDNDIKEIKLAAAAAAAAEIIPEEEEDSGRGDDTDLNEEDSNDFQNEESEAFQAHGFSAFEESANMGTFTNTSENFPIENLNFEGATSVDYTATEAENDFHDLDSGPVQNPHQDVEGSNGEEHSSQETRQAEEEEDDEPSSKKIKIL